MAALLIVAAVGCAPADYDRIRRTHATDSLDAYGDRTREAIGESPVDLDTCVRIAIANSLALKAGEIDRQLATLDRRIAFAEFLPFITGHFLYRDLERPQIRRINDRFFQATDKAVADTLIDAELPIFSPSIWFLYSARRTGEQTAGLTLLRTRQLLTLQVTSLYYGVLCHQAQQRYLREATEQAEALRAETAANVEQGLAMRSELLSVEATLQTRRSQLRANGRLIRVTKAALLEVMGLSPLGEVELVEPAAPAAIEGEPAELVLRALLTRPELQRADRTIEIRRDEMRIAISELLPKVYGVADVTHTTDSFIRFAFNAGLGVEGFLRIFDGFASLHEYAAARKRKEADFIRREQLCLAVMLEVLRAQQHVQDAADNVRVTTATEAAKIAVLEEINARAREELVKTSDRLKAQAEWDRSRADRAVAKYGYHTAMATLADVVGDTRDRYATR